MKRAFAFVFHEKGLLRATNFPAYALLGYQNNWRLSALRACTLLVACIYVVFRQTLSQGDMFSRITFLSKNCHWHHMDLLLWSVVSIIQGSLRHMDQSTADSSRYYISPCPTAWCWYPRMTALSDLSPLGVLRRSFLLYKDHRRRINKCLFLLTRTLEWTRWVLQAVHFQLTLRLSSIDWQHLLYLSKLDIDRLWMLWIRRVRLLFEVVILDVHWFEILCNCLALTYHLVLPGVILT